MVQSLDDAWRRSRSGTTGRVPPHNLQAEESLLGAMLLSRDAIAAAVETCGVEDFYKPAHGHVFDAICSLYGQGEPADPVTVADELRRADLLEAIGGPGTLISLQANTPATANAGRYARIVEEHALLRRLIGVAGEIAEIGYGVPDDVAQAIDRAESMVFEIAERRVTDTLRPLHDLLSESLDRLEALYDRGESITGVPTGYLDLDERLSGLQPSNLVIVGARPSMGKAQPIDTPVLGPGGWRTLGSLRVGDLVIGADGRPTRVAGVFPQGRLPVYRVSLSDRTSTRTCAEHLWLVQTGHDLSNGRPGAVKSTAQIAAALAAGKLRHHHIPVVAPVQHPGRDLPLDPYLLGLLLGNGAFGRGVPGFTTTDAELLAAVESRLPFGVVAKQVPSDPTTYTLSGGLGGDRPNPLAETLQALGLWGRRSDARFIPPKYLHASEYQRLALLQGLMDTDGWHYRHCTQYATSSLAMANGVAELTRSLGGVARVRVNRTKGPFRNNVGGRSTFTLVAYEVRPVGRPRCFYTGPNRRLSYNVVVTLPTSVIPFRLQRKIDGVTDDQAAGVREGRRPDHRIVSVVAEGEAECLCIAVDAPDNLYVTEDHIVTHNTALALGMAAHASMEGRIPVLFFSLEMSHAEVTQRLLCAEARVDSSRIRNGKLLESDWPKISHAIGRLGEAPLYIDDNANLTIMEIRAKARRLRSRLGSLGLIIVDYLQLMSGRHSAENRQVEVSEISRGLKILARELEVPVVALSQLSRNLEMRADKRPMLADLRESGCMPAATRLLRADTGSEVTLGELVASGARDIPVLSMDDAGRLVPACLTHAFSSGIKPVFRLQTASGRSVEATANHRFRTPSGWTALGDLTVGDRLAVPRHMVTSGTPVPVDHDTFIRFAHGDQEFIERRGGLLAGGPQVTLATTDVTWDEVVAVEHRGDKAVFDATVLGTHNFIANGIIAHNSLEQDADVVMFLYRDEVYNPESPDRGTAEIIVSKHRNGPTGITQLAFLDHYTRFANMARV